MVCEIISLGTGFTFHLEISITVAKNRCLHQYLGATGVAASG